LALLENLVPAAQLDVAGRRVFVRADLDIPCSPHGAVLDDTRLRDVLPVLRMLSSAGAKVLLASHYGPPDAPNAKAPEGIARRLGELLGAKLGVAPPRFAQIAGPMKPGDIALLPNLWLFHGERENDAGLAREWAEHIDVYVNEALRSSLDVRASTSALPRLMNARGMGAMTTDELSNLAPYIETPQRPFSALIGGARLREKAPLIEALLPHTDTLLLGGVVANTFLAAEGVALGQSVIENDALDVARQILARARGRGVAVKLPLDFVVRARDDASSAPKLERKMVGELGRYDTVVDVALETCVAYREDLARSAMAVWNGVMGLCDHEDTSSGTIRIAQAATAAGYSLAAGEGTTAAVAYFNLVAQFSHISNSGPAGRELLCGTVFPGIEALRMGV